MQNLKENQEEERNKVAADVDVRVENRLTEAIASRIATKLELKRQEMALNVQNKALEH
jgi:hypothetical protein